ncbi:MAG: hypothetical protein NZ455_14345 [Bacteroidia bacterium]|nr:hypothetical protein [Bacteroidia bacterium]
MLLLISKKLKLVVIPLFLFSLCLRAQGVYTHRVFLKIEPIHVITGQVGIFVEKHFSKRSAIEFGGGFIFSDYTDRIFLPDFIQREQILRTEGYVLRTNYRRYRQVIKENIQVSPYFQIDFFVKVIDYSPLERENCTLYSLKDVVGLSFNWGKPKITTQWWVRDIYSGVGIRVKYYATDRCSAGSGYLSILPPKEITQIFPFFQVGVKFGKMIDKKKNRLA